MLLHGHTYLDFVSFVSRGFNGDSINLKLSLHQSNANRFLWFLITTKCHIIIFSLGAFVFITLRSLLFTSHTHSPLPLLTRVTEKEENTFMSFLFFPSKGRRRKAMEIYGIFEEWGWGGDFLIACFLKMTSFYPHATSLGFHEDTLLFSEGLNFPFIFHLAQ